MRSFDVFRLRQGFALRALWLTMRFPPAYFRAQARSNHHAAATDRGV
jgi:hypothetical protein